MEKEKRKARTKVVKEVDFSEPILNIEILGSKDDPCFGKLFKPDAEECMRCGDSEVCSIVVGQMSHIQRKLIEKEGNFKDLEEDEIPPLDRKELKRKIKTRIRELIKMSPKGIAQDKLIADIYATYSLHGFSKKTIKLILEKLTDVTDSFTYNKTKDLYLWKK
jgi:hypothetical protein